MQFLIFMAYACVCVVVAIGVAPPQLARPGRRPVGVALTVASAAALVAALWLVAMPIPSFIGHGAPHEEAAAPAPRPVAPPATGPVTLVPTTAPRPTAAATHEPAVVASPGQGTSEGPSSPPVTSPSSPPATSPPTHQPPPTTGPPPTQPPPTQPPPTDGPGPVGGLVQAVVHDVKTVLAPVGHLI